MKKPTGTGEASQLHERALQIEEDMHNQEETLAVNDDWSDSQHGGDDDDELPPLPPPINIKAEPAPPIDLSPAKHRLAAAPPPFAAKGKAPAIPKASASTPASRPAKTEDIIDIPSLDSEGDVPAPAPAASRSKSKKGVEPGLRVRKAPATPVPAKSTTSRARKSSTTTSTTLDPMAERLIEYLDPEIDRQAADKRHTHDMERMLLYNKEREIENLRRELGQEKERRHQVERQLDQATLVLSLHGLPVPWAPHSKTSPAALASQATLSLPGNQIANAIAQPGQPIAANHPVAPANALPAGPAEVPTDADQLAVAAVAAAPAPALPVDVANDAVAQLEQNIPGSVEQAQEL